MSDLPPPEPYTGRDPPLVHALPAGAESRSWLVRHARVSAPMGPRPAPGATRGTIVLAEGRGSNVLDVDGNRYVDLAGGFGALLVGHAHPSVTRALSLQAERLMQALGDVHPSQPKIALLERLCALYPGPAQGILAQSGSDALAAALKTAVLATGRPGVIAFSGSYHGLGYGPLAVSGLRAGYREPFAAQLNPHARFVEYPSSSEASARTLADVRRELAAGDVGAVVIEPILGRGGVIPPPPGFLTELAALARESGALLVADEVWTGLGRSGRMLASLAETTPDLVCLGKGLGGGLPVSALVGRAAVLASWRREAEVVHTATFAGAPLACTTALATLDVLSREKLVERAARVGAAFRDALAAALDGHALAPAVRGQGLMIGVDLGERPGAGAALAAALLARGYVTSTGGGRREVLVLTPALNVDEALLSGFVPELVAALAEIAP